MKRFNLLAVSFLFAAIFSVSAFAQAGAVPAASKIGWLDTGAFADEKEGVTKYVAGLKALDNEMKPRVTELQTMQSKLKVISDDLAKMQANTAVPVDRKLLRPSRTGTETAENLIFKKKEIRPPVEKRQRQVLRPVSATIFRR